MTYPITPTRPIVLCLSGHDPTGGAGIAADIETIFALNCHAAPVITALTIQNTINVTDFKVLDADWVITQAQTVLTDMPVAAIKLGMLGSSDIVHTVASIITRYPQFPVICDPVLKAGGGGSLEKDTIVTLLREKLLPLITIATPNLPEARLLANLPEASADQCAEKLMKYCKNLLITGGHEEGSDIVNRLYTSETVKRFTYPRLPKEYHGSGCTLASALAARLATGERLISAVETALNYTWLTLKDADTLGQGQLIPHRLIIT